MIGEDARREGFQELDSPHHPIAAPEAPCPTAAFTDGEAFQEHREALFPLGIGEAEAGLWVMHGAGAMEPRSRAGAGAAEDGIKVLIAPIAEGKAVHGALGGHDPKGVEEGVGIVLWFGEFQALVAT
uniref:Uncharacterized protein n=1 Tax=Candidatus Kentrum sp. UNK TaxID=2126344 RepID=A0A451B4Z8_9GAMM|nr:MAG: hypothetical protein BECKUNK1418G_GA0071005_11933 [Candidatus Kentron sp. UNK]VFK73346.1 MAG: hypothetical protein BECKUNK1418H_GA0071006_11913 [Candidatus Kentron sp. UNK]